ncbi:MAG: rod shape-determining protein [Candidatus Dadabacteria bacterium]|nr:rod shape-determining protein [Candidatus Dadabacteria bacterium]
MILDKLLEYFSNDLAIDLGTANTLVYLKGKGIVSNEPSVVAVQNIPGQKSKLIAAGKHAREMVGRTPESIRAIRPLRDGVIADFEAAQKMIEYFIKKSNGHKKSLVRPRVVISVPLEITEVEKRAVKESAEAAGARRVYLIEETMCAAIGSGIEVHRPSGNMVVDIGGGTTGIGVIALSGIVVSKSIKTGGDKMDEAIQQWLKRNHNIVIGNRTAEELKKKFSTHPETNSGRKMQMKVTGRNNISGVPSMLTIDTEEIGEAVEETINQIVDAIMQTLERTPPELSADVFESGIMLAGGGSLLRGLRNRIEQKTGIHIKTAEQPLDCVVMGSGKALEDIDLLTSVAI